MKFVRVMHDGLPHWGVLDGQIVRLLTRAPYTDVSCSGVELPFDSCRLLAPCEPGKIVCVGKNYRDHALELGGFVPETPILFIKSPNTLNDPESVIRAPDFVKRLDYECELAFVVKRKAKNVPPEDFAKYVLGYTCLNDVTARDIQEMDGQWTRAKCMDGFCPVGPVLTDEVDASCVPVSTRLNGKTVQKGNTSDFMHKLPELLAFITASMTLEPGDLVTTGTPAGIGPMHPGDTVEVEIPGIGVLRNYVK